MLFCMFFFRYMFEVLKVIFYLAYKQVDKRGRNFHTLRTSVCNMIAYSWRSEVVLFVLYMRGGGVVW